MLDELPAVIVPAFVEGGLEPGKVVNGRIAARRLVGRKERGSGSALEFNRNNLALELAFFDRIQCAAMALYCQFILVFAGYAPLARDVLRRVAHMDLVERVSQSCDEGVNRGDVVQPRPPPHCRQPVRGPAHGLGAAANGGIRISMHDRIRGRHDGLQAASAHPVQRQSRSVDLQAAAQRGYARQIHVLGVGMNYITEDNMTYIGRGQSRALQTLTDNLGCQFAGRNIFEGASEFPNGGPYSAQYNNFSMSHKAESFRSPG